MGAFSMKRELSKLDKYIKVAQSSGRLRGGWKKSTVKVRLICERLKWSEDDAPRLEVPNFYHKDLVDVITKAYEMLPDLHLTPYDLLWDPGDGRPR
ncbi:hypothetical protein BC834DRAFT_920632, partial [Gloeopeniophorella convolvens]